MLRRQNTCYKKLNALFIIEGERHLHTLHNSITYINDIFIPFNDKKTYFLI